MGKVSVFNFVTLSGHFEGPKSDISWHMHGAEESEFAVEGLKSGNTLLFGRVTYELMASYWPTSYAMENDPVLAAGMNRAGKVVFSRTLEKADWSNTRLVKGDVGEEVERMKRAAGKDMTLMGSGSILTQLAERGLSGNVLLCYRPAERA
jgi:dihydrofolate reductase